MLVQSFRDTLPKAKQLGHRVVEQFDDIIAQFSGLWNVQHKEDGSHGDITADSIDVTGDLTVGGNLFATLASAVMSRLRLTSVSPPALVFSTEEDDNSVTLTRAQSTSSLEHSGNFIPAESLTYSLGLSTRVYTALWGLVTKIGGVGGTATLAYDIVNGGLSVDDDLLPDATASRDLGAPGGAAKRWQNLYLSSAVFEAARTVAMGYPIAQAFDAGDYTGLAPMTWTVDAAAANTNTYTRIGKAILWTVTILAGSGTSATGGTPSSQLLIKVPGGLTLNTSVLFTNKVAYASDGSGVVTARVQIADSTHVLIVQDNGANWTGSVTLLFQVQMFEAS